MDNNNENCIDVLNLRGGTEICGRCEFFVEDAQVPWDAIDGIQQFIAKGWCYRFPPRSSNAEDQIWPNVWGSDFCGEFRWDGTQSVLKINPMPEEE